MAKEVRKYRKQLVKNFIDWWGTIPRDKLKLSDILQVIYQGGIDKYGKRSS